MNRKQELIDRILDRTPYIKNDDPRSVRARLERKLERVLTEDNLYILAQATNIPSRDRPIPAVVMQSGLDRI